MTFERKLILKPPALIYIRVPVIDLVPVFQMDELALEAVLQLGNAASQYNLATVGYSILPSYMQALVAPHEDFDLSEFLYTYKWLSSRAVICMELGKFAPLLMRKGKFKLWMRRYDHHTITSNTQFQKRLDYIHNDPVEKGLAKTPPDWRFSSAGDWLLHRDGYIEVEKDLDWIGLE